MSTAEVSADLREIRADIGKVEASVADLKTDVALMQKDLGVLVKDIDLIQTSVKSLAEKVKSPPTLGAAVSALTTSAVSNPKVVVQILLLLLAAFGLAPATYAVASNANALAEMADTVVAPLVIPAEPVAPPTIPVE